MSTGTIVPMTARWPAAASPVGQAALAVVGTLLLWASAKVQVPFWPVPMTMQTGVVVLLAAFYGPRLAFATVLLYLVEGAWGLPVLAGTPERGIGLPYMLGPTGGYMVGWLAATLLVGHLLQHVVRPAAVLATMMAGMLVIYAFGFTWLATLVGPAAAVTAGIAPFVLGDLVKSGLATALVLAVARQRA